MAVIPQILLLEPSSPTVDSAAPSPRSTKSRFRFLFHWRKCANNSQRPSTRAGDECAPQIANLRAVSPRPDLNARSRSEMSENLGARRARSTHGRRTLAKDRILADPPLLAQVQGQAILHASIETPLTFTEKFRSRRPSLGHRDVVAQDNVDTTVEVKRSHKRTESAESSCSTVEKSFFLINGPYILQYDGENEGMAVPEKILSLDQNSTAFTCDAVPGHPWTLQVSKANPLMQKPVSQNLRPSWSRLTLRQTEDKRLVNTMLLVFNDSDELHTWLFAIRKEIEDLGGLESNPHVDDDDRTWRENLARKYASGSESESPMRTSSTNDSRTINGNREASKVASSSAVPCAPRSKSVRSSGSSKNTATSLDRLRDSVTSDGYTSILATCSADGSAPSNSPICENFPGSKLAADESSKLFFRIFHQNDSLDGQQLRPKQSQSILERRKLSMNFLQLAQPEEPRARKIPLSLPSTISGFPNDDSPARTAGVTTSPLGATAFSADDASELPQPADLKDETNETKPGVTGQTRTCLETLLEEPAAEPPRPKYSLFPVRPPVEVKAELLASPTTLASVTKSSKKSNLPNFNVVASPQKDANHQKDRSRTVTLELRQHRVSALLGAGEFHNPQRSPAVTDDMIMSNFGVAYDDPPLSPMPEIRVPGLNDLSIDLDFLKKPYAAQFRRKSSTNDTRRASSTKSISSMHNESQPMVSKVPIGPPPGRPLPAVPPECRRGSRGSRSSQQRQPSLSRSGSEQLLQDAQPGSISEKVFVGSILPPSYNPIAFELKHHHRRTISSSTDGPPPPTRMSSKLSSSLRSRSQSRSRRKSSKAG